MNTIDYGTCSKCLKDFDEDTLIDVNGSYECKDCYFPETQFQMKAMIQNKVRFPVHYGKWSDGRICITSNNYSGFDGLKGFEIIDDSDSMTDYFERPHIYLFPDHKYYDEVSKVIVEIENSQDKKYEKKRLKAAMLLESVENKKKVQGIWFEVIKQEPHHKLEGFTAFILKKISTKAKKQYYYAESNDGKRYIPLMTI